MYPIYIYHLDTLLPLEFGRRALLAGLNTQTGEVVAIKQFTIGKISAAEVESLRVTLIICWNLHING